LTSGSSISKGARLWPDVPAGLGTLTERRPPPEEVPELEAYPSAPESRNATGATSDPTAPDWTTDAQGASSVGLDERPWADSQFWILQFGVLALYLIRLAAMVAFHIDSTSTLSVCSTIVLFIGPAVYAAIRYGFRGALWTTAGITVLAVPRLVTAIANHQSSIAWAEVTQVLIIDAVGLLIGQRVSGRHLAIRTSESSRKAHLSAEALYRDLFDSNQAPILIVDGSGAVVEANASAHRVFRATRAIPGIGRTGPSTDGTTLRLVDMIGAEAAAQVLTRLLDSQVSGATGNIHAAVPVAGPPDVGDEPVEPLTFDVDGHPAFFRPTGTMLSRSGAGTRMQVVFEDVTAETRRHDLMEAYASRVVLGQEEERRHLAQELHDGPVQTLIHLCRQIDGLEGSQELSAESADVLADLRVITEGTVSELRSIAQGLRPSVLDDLGLVASINQLLSAAGARQQFETSFGVTGAERRVSAPVELALFRIAQEAITNVERHAQAGHLAVGLSFEAGGLRLLIKDDGAGFVMADRDQRSGTQSLGLPGMTERAHLINAQLRIHSTPGAGTAVDVWVPATVIGQK
jgi:signal transduction histidine kinase